ncbi:hypothetical protein BAUCODRAFT_22311 [Baudoinia panamericana UAMH 10762]|uniref:Phosphatidylserine decarboxylase proenzyme 2 n=1 Tax=Baudoinia panamericana (strain UAMH 10762) TaxID=717646 RepID=M2LWJ0_BAUPA|nr:uncharacterized protein BAUCODRAFT_22311 [Baudoinia panamericana UAMH 10762]EMC99012.1 hypothetical protein BAUCODRAFT_22311 [Baudoinia panamericana UAMH 10762]
MPRPHIPHHLSLHRVKSDSYHSNVQPSSAPSTPPTRSRNVSPTRSLTGVEKDNMARRKDAPAPVSSNERGDHKGMGLSCRVHVMRARNLAPKDKSGTSDPFLVLTLGEAKEATSVISKTLNPEWNQTFEFPVTEADSALLEAVCWDKDRFKKDYMGEFDVMLDDIFSSGNTTPDARWFKLESRRSGRRKKKDDNVTGEVQLKFTLFDPLNTAATPQHVLQKFHGVIADTGIDGEDEDDDNDDELLNKLNSRDLDDVYEEEANADDQDALDETADDGVRTPGDRQTIESAEKQKRRRMEKIKLKRKSKLKTYEFTGGSDVAGVLFLEINRITDLPPERNMTRTGFDMDPFVVTSLGKKTYRTRVVNHNLNPVYDEKLVFQVSKHELNYSLSFAVVDRDKFTGNDFVGTAMFPVEKVRSLAPVADEQTGLYKLPDPDAVTDAETRRRKWRVSMSRSTSQTNIGRLSRNNSGTNLNKLTRTTSNTSLSNMAVAAGVSPNKPSLRRQGSSDGDTIERQQRPAPTSYPSQAPSVKANGTGSAHDNADSGTGDETGLYTYDLPLELKNKSRWEDKHNPVLQIRAKYLPYNALRQQFWRVMLRQYDADESGKIDRVELVTMLDTLGSTLHNSTIDGFFKRFRSENGGEEILTMDQAVLCLEEQLRKTSHHHSYMSSPQWRKHSGSDPRTSSARFGMLDGSSPETSPPGGTPYLAGLDRTPSNFSTSTSQIPTLEVSDLSEAGERGDRLPGNDLADANATQGSSPDLNPMASPDLMAQDADEFDATSNEEHVVEIHECPICHLPRLSRGRRTTDADIITHIATCASSDWRAVNNLVMAGFVSSSQAQRKWYTKVLTKVGYGGYRLGANSANILVQDRLTGLINEERMSVYVRLGIRLLYKGLKSKEMEKKRIRKLLRSLSFKQGRKYDDPASAAQIPGFVNFHQLNLTEVLRPLEEFKTFNEFFYRELKPDARPCCAPDNPHIIVSPSDCRSVVFNRMEEAQKIWVKGRDFSIEKLLGQAYPDDAKRYRNGALGIMRLAPQDYHRFHIPVDGTMGEPKLIEGEYYTVNPMAIRSALDVYGENVRVCVPIDSECHGRVMVVCVGAMMVGSTVITRQTGDKVKRAEELGYFKFGGSTLLLLFEPGVMRFDDDLVGNSNGALETLVQVGMSIGHSPHVEQHRPYPKKDHLTLEEKQEAKRRIEGSLAPSTGAVLACFGIDIQAMQTSEDFRLCAGPVMHCVIANFPLIPDPAGTGRHSDAGVPLHLYSVDITAYKLRRWMAMPADDTSNAVATDGVKGDATPQASESVQARAKTSINRLFSVPPPVKRIFDKFPLITYETNALPLRAPRGREEHVLHVFTSEEGSQHGRPSYNPACLKWQAYLKFTSISFRTVPSSNHASPSGALPFLIPSSFTDEAAKTQSTIPSNRLKRWVANQQQAEKPEEPADVRYEAYASLLEIRIRNAWLYQLYLEPANTGLVHRLYIAPCSSNPLVQMTIAYQLRQAAEAEILKARPASAPANIILEDDVYRDAGEAFEALSSLLANDQCFFSQAKPGLFDASVFAYTQLLLDDTLNWSENRLGQKLKALDNLVRHRNRVLDTYF